MATNQLLDKEISAFRNFTFILAASVGLFGFVLAFTAGWVVNDHVMREAANDTRLVLKERLADEGSLAVALHKPSTAGVYDNLLQQTRNHFDLHDIRQTRFVEPDGIMTFSYNPSEIGGTLNTGDHAFFAKAAYTKADDSMVKGSRLFFWMPVQDSSGTLLGVVEAERDVSGQVAAVRRILLVLIAVIIAGSVILFFSLRKMFILTTRTIDRQNKELGEFVSRIERTYDQSLQALSSALDSRDYETQGHSLRVTAYAVRLGREMRLSNEEIGLLARGALLHDVGKIGIPDAILLKKESLDEKEFRKMQDHVKLGYRVLQHIEFLQPSLDVVKYHHERWEGNGYPYGIQGEQIPLFARIFSLCDAYDAITSDRPYRKGKSYAGAREEIAHCRGTQFAPDVVDAFLRIPEEDWTHFERLSQDPIMIMQRDLLVG